MIEQKKDIAQIDILGNIYNNILKGLSMGKTLIMLQGSARCFAKGTRVRMANGRLKNVEDIEVGDRLMSADGNGYNTVTETHGGFDNMYKVHQNRGLDYIVNSKHILSLIQTEAFTHKVRASRIGEPYIYRREPIPYDNRAIHNFNIGYYNSQSKNFKRRFAGTKNTLLQLPHSELPIDPYYLGVWLGDGASKSWHFISNVDIEVRDYVRNYAQSLGTTIQKVDDVSYRLVVHKGGMRNKKINERVAAVYNAFRKYNLICNKYIPDDFIYTSYTNRLKILAGLLDSDGYKTNRNTIAITQKNRKIAEAIVELCHITGFYTNGIVTKIAKMKRDDGSIYECEVYIVEINHNDFNDLNRYMQVKRKRIEGKHCLRNYYSTKISIGNCGVGEYYGFTLDNSPYFLLEDGTLVHNSGKSRNTMIFLCLQCINEVKKVSVVRQSLPTIKRSILEDFKIVMQQMGQWEDRRFNKTDFVYYFPNGSIMEFFSAEDEQKLRGPSRDILYANEANEISYHAFSNLRMRTYGFCIVDYNPTFTEEHWLFPLMTDERTYLFKSTFEDNIFLPKAARDEILSYKETNPALWKIYGEGEFAIIDGLVFPKENWDIIPDENYPTWLGEEYIGIDWGFATDPTTFIGVIINDDDIYARELCYATGMRTHDIAKALEPYKDNYKYCDIDNRLVTELEEAGIPMLTMTRKNGESIMSGIRLMNQRHIHITTSSTDLIKEFRNYVYKKDRHETYQTSLRPIDKFNHCIDALRYVVYAECGGNRFDDTRGFTKEELGLFM